MRPVILDIIDFEKINTLLEGFNKSTGFVTAILDLKGNVLFQSGWRQICTDFHRIHPATAARCTISDTILAAKLAKGEDYHFYKCLNGLVDVAVPIIIRGEHIANLFSGQFFIDKPDRSFFIEQAQKYGFDEQAYLQAFESVPVVSVENVKSTMSFLLNMTRLMCELVLQKMEQTELNDALKKSEEHHKNILRTIMDGFFLINIQGHILEVNDIYCRMSGYSESELLSMCVADLQTEKTMDEISGFLQKIKEPGSAHFESIHRKKDGSLFQVEVNAQYSNTSDDQVMVFLRDITERKMAEEKIMESQAKLSEALEISNRSRLSLLSILEDQRRAQQEIKTLNAELEQRVIERTAQLEALNKELEAFSYSVSHDLRAPLRGIDGFSLALVEDYEDQLDDIAKDYINRIRNATKKMDGLIDSLLRLSRISRLEMSYEDVNLSDIVDKITSSLKESDKDRNAEFIIQKDIIAHCDGNLIKIVFDNLLSNAWKFTSKKDKTTIEFGTLNKNFKTTYFVKDNGIGFDMQYVDKLFSAFQRLHSDKEYPGIGVGLTTVQRIIRKHNGEIWVESRLNEGTTFYFTL